MSAETLIESRFEVASRRQLPRAGANQECLDAGALYQDVSRGLPKCLLKSAFGS